MRRLLTWCGGGDDFPQLFEGVRYVCDVHGRGGRLEVLEFEEIRTWTAPQHVLADGVIDSGQQALLRDGEGRCHALLRINVLWPETNHDDIVAATSSLGLPLVPRRRRPVPEWRMGATVLQPQGLAALGRLLTAR